MGIKLQWQDIDWSKASIYVIQIIVHNGNINQMTYIEGGKLSSYHIGKEEIFKGKKITDFKKNLFIKTNLQFVHI